MTLYNMAIYNYYEFSQLYPNCLCSIELHLIISNRWIAKCYTKQFKLHTDVIDINKITNRHASNLI